jgi:hypothetical protein
MLVRIIRNINSVWEGGIQRFLMLKRMVHTITTVKN